MIKAILGTVMILLAIGIYIFARKANKEFNETHKSIPVNKMNSRQLTKLIKSQQ